VHLQASFDAGVQGVMSEKGVPGVSNKNGEATLGRSTIRYHRCTVVGTYDLGMMLREISAGGPALDLLYLGRGLNSTTQPALGAYDWRVAKE